MKRKRAKALLAVCLCLLTCGLVNTTLATEKLQIGVSASLSGPAVGWGQPCYRTILTQAELYNRSGGVEIGGKKYLIELKVADDKYLAESGAAAIRKLVFQDKVDYILLGGPSTLVALAGGPICQQNEVLFLCDGTSGPGLAKELTWVFRPCLTDYSRGVAITMWLSENKREIKKVVYACPDTEGGHVSANVFKDNIKRFTNWNLLAGEFYEAGSKEYYPILSKLLKHKPDLIYTDTATTGDLGLLAKQARELGYEGPFFQAAMVDPKIVCGISGQKACENIYNPGYARDVTPGLKKLYDAYFDTYGEYNALTTWSCDFLYVLIQAMQVAGTTDKYKVREVLERAVHPNVINSLVGKGARFYTEKYLDKEYGHQWLRPIGVMRIHNGDSDVLGIYPTDEMMRNFKRSK